MIELSHITKLGGNDLKKFFKSAMVFSLITLAISCGPGKRRSELGLQKQEFKFPQIYESKEKAIKGGTYKVAVVSQSPMNGIFYGLLIDYVTDSYFEGPIAAPLFVNDHDFMTGDRGLAKTDIDVDNKVVTVTLRDNLKWDDGQPLTIDDYIFTYEVIGNKEYTGTRYDDSLRQVIGMEEYHQGKADKISGLEKVNDTTLKIHLKEVSPSVYYSGGGVLQGIMPKHHLQDVAVKDLMKSEKVRLHPVGAGQYKVKQVIPGESVEYVPNENYYKKEDIPQVNNMIIKILPDSAVLASMKAGEYDSYIQVSPDLYTEYKDLNNLVILGRPAISYSYLGFNLGHFDAKKGENVTNTNAKLYDINLRKAIGYSINAEEIISSFYNGLKERANGVIPPAFEKVYEKKARYTYNPEKAKEILDKAGYKDVDGDGIREDKNGKPLEIHLAMAASGEIAEPLAQKVIQDWKKVGLNVTLSGGRLIEGNSFFEKIKANDKDIDMWLAGWSVGTTLDLNGIYSRKSPFNVARISTPENDELILKTNSLQATKDPNFRIQAIREWEENYMNNVLGYFPLWVGYELFPINKRVKYSSCLYDDSGIKTPHPTALTTMETISAK